jgi:hypothetical protein
MQIRERYYSFQNILIWELSSPEKLNILSSPDSSGNPFCFFFKNKKIVTDSGTELDKCANLLLLKTKNCKMLPACSFKDFNVFI